MKQSGEEKIINVFVIVIFILIFMAFTLTFFSKAYLEKGPAAYREILIFISLLAVVIGFALVAKWQFNESYKGKIEKSDEEKNEKNFFRRIVAKENIIFNNIIKTSFHILPLYFTLIIVKIKLGMEYKAMLFVLSIFSYMLVELKYLYGKIFTLAGYIRKKFKIESTKGLLFILFLTFILLSLGTIYFAYTLIMFYYHRFS